jgi:hypothetical protein
MELLNSDSRLLAKLRDDSELYQYLLSLRSVALSLSETTMRTVPNFTDHTIRHMDALWGIADQILTPEEIAKMTAAEAFLLGASFYLHDIGMAYAATDEAQDTLRKSPEYRASKAQGQLEANPDLEAQALSTAVRSLHATVARQFAISEIPGSQGVYLFEALSVREAWGLTCGDLASSHHWSLSQLDTHFGPQCEAPLPGNRTADLLYVACCLRLIDYAHINRDRAPAIDRAFRGPINKQSALHWSAQENIDGPIRADNELVYRAAKPIAVVEAWWLFYQMLRGLDDEIRAVHRLLARRKENLKRISLSGVRGSSSPEEAVAFIPTGGFLPIEVDLRTGSIDRLVELLAGETLYGPNPMAAVRELIQNARDAVMLKRETAKGELEKATLSLPITISLDTRSDPATLEIVDYGVGMTKTVITDYLVTIASDYWSTRFATDFPEVAEKGFRNAGKFGIGFLSVFMLGSEVEVETHRLGDERFRLSLHGAGRRGELRSIAPPEASGTKVLIKLRPEVVESITPLDELVRIYAPTLPHALRIKINASSFDLPIGWFNELETQEFVSWVLAALRKMRRTGTARPVAAFEVGFLFHERMKSSWPLQRPEYRGVDGRLVASFEGWSLISLRGLAVQPMRTPGFVGVIDLDSAALDVSRNRTVSADIDKVLKAAREATLPQIIENLNSLGKIGLLIESYNFIAACVESYGSEALRRSDTPWINHLTMSGNLELISSSELLIEASKVASIFVVFGAGPWIAMRKWAESGSLSSHQDLAVLIDDAERRGPGYLSDREAENKIGNLKSLWPEALSHPFMSTFATIISDAWLVSAEDLLEQEGWTHERSIIYGRWKKK